MESRTTRAVLFRLASLVAAFAVGTSGSQAFQGGLGAAAGLGGGPGLQVGPCAGGNVCPGGCATAELVLPQVEVGPARPSSGFPDIVLPKFDPALGSLQSVRIQLALTAADRSFGFENVSNQPCTINLNQQQNCPVLIELGVEVYGPHSATTPIYTEPNFGTRHGTLPNITFGAFDGVADQFSPAGPADQQCPYVDTNVLENQGQICATFNPPGGDLPVLDGFGGAPTPASPGAGSGFAMCWPDSQIVPSEVCISQPADVAAYVASAGNTTFVLDNVVADQSFANMQGICNGNNDFKVRVKARVAAQITYVYCPPCNVDAGDITVRACSGEPTTFCLPISVECGTVDCASGIVIDPVAGGGTFQLVACPDPGSCPGAGCCVQYTSPPGFAGTVSTKYTVTGSGAGGATCSDSGTINVQVCRVDAQDVPGARVCVGGTTTICLPIDVSGPDACGTVPCDPEHVLLGALTPPVGTLSLAACPANPPCGGCCVQYTAPPDATETSVSFTYTAITNTPEACDDTGTVTIGLCRVAATGDVARTCADQAVTIDVLGNDQVLGNGSCAPIDCHSLAIQTPPDPACGTAAVLPGCANQGGPCGNCQIVFTPNPAFAGTCTFTYSVSSGNGCAAVATVTVRVCKVDAPDVVGPKVCAGDSTTFCLPISVLGGAGCGTVPCDPQHVVLGTPSYGSVALASCGTKSCTGCCVVFTAPDNGAATPASATFTYTAISNAALACDDVGTVTVEICRIVAEPNSATTCSDEAVTIDVLANDGVFGGTSCAPIDCHSLVIDTPPDPNCGTAAVLPGCANPNGPCSGCQIVFTPNPAFLGTCSFTYRVSSGDGCSAVGTVDVQVCQVIAADVSGPKVCAGGSTTFCLPIGVFGGGVCGTVPCDPQHVVLGTPTYGSVALASCGATPCTGCCVVFTAPDGGAATPASATFTYTAIADSDDACDDTGTVTIDICRVVAQADSKRTCTDEPVTIDVLGNDQVFGGGTCAPIDCHSLAILTPPDPACGTAAVLPGCANSGGPCSDCQIVFTPAPGFFGTCSFTYRVSTGGPEACAATGTVTVQVCEVDAGDVTAKVCSGGTATVCLPITVSGPAGCGVVPCDPQHVVLGALTPPVGSIQLVGCPSNPPCGGCCVQYTAPANPAVTSVSFVYTAIATSAEACDDTGTVTIDLCTVVADAETAATCNDEAVTIDVLAGDFVFGGGACPPLDCHSLAIQTPPDPACGTAAVLPGCASAGAPCGQCQIVFTPNPNFAGACSFTYRVSTLASPGVPACTGIGSVDVKVAGAPTAVDDPIPADLCPEVGVPVIFDVLANDTPGLDCGTLTTLELAIQTPPTHGTAVVIQDHPAFGRDVIEYTATASFLGEDGFTYEITNECGCDDKGQVTIGCEQCPTRNRDICASLLLFPEFDNTPGRMTLTTITDACCDYPAPSQRKIEVVFLREGSCTEFNRTYNLTDCDTVSFITGHQAPSLSRGFLYAFAKGAPAPGYLNGVPIVYNHYVGQTLRLDGINAFEYAINAISFRGLGVEGAANDDDGDGIRDLNGPDALLPEYEEAPDEIVIPRFLGQDPPGGTFQSDLVLLGLSGGAKFTTVLDVLVFNDNEIALSDQFEFQCWTKVPLRDFSTATLQSTLEFGDDPLEIVGLPQREAGWIRIDGNVAYSTQAQILDPAFYAVLIERSGATHAATLPWELCVNTRDGGDGGDLLPQSLLGDTDNE